MSAQTFSAGIPNGTDAREDRPVGGLCGAVETGDAGGISSDTRGDEQLRDLGGPMSSGLQDDGVGFFFSLCKALRQTATPIKPQQF